MKSERSLPPMLFSSLLLSFSVLNNLNFSHYVFAQQREKIEAKMEEGNFDYSHFLEFDQFYHFSLCHLCKSQAPNLKKCSSCKIVFYCSKDHQKKDWNEHKELCKAIKKSVVECLTKGTGGRDSKALSTLKYLLRIQWSSELGRNLRLYEENMWMFPKICAVCYSGKADIICGNCKSVAYCTNDHRDEDKNAHEEFCKGFQTNLAMLVKFGQHLGALESFDEIKIDWANLRELPKKLPENLEKCVKLLGFNYEGECSDAHINFIHIADCYSVICNIIFGLELAGKIVNHVASEPNLVVHIVGADKSESLLHWITNVEFLAHWAPNLKSIEIYFIGPEATELERFNLSELCSKCKDRGLIVKLAIVKKLYHDVLHRLPKPTIVCAFNSGLNLYVNYPEQDTWKKSLPSLIHYQNTPLILTSLTTEINDDLQRYKQGEIEYLLPMQRNPYSSMEPQRNCEVGEVPIYYRNGYIVIIKKK